MFMFHALLTETEQPSRQSERGSALVEWLGISALSIGIMVGLFAALEQVGLSVIDTIRGSLGV